MLATPVVFIIFNRPELTYSVFDSIARARPRKLFVVADGPRSVEETDRCLRARAIVDRVDWDCEVSTNFSDVNLGCRRRVSGGLDWAFSKVDEAIILEDDCLPSPSFFHFCENLLDKYRHDERVMHIGGANFQKGQSRTADSYYFSRYSHIWGWASWRRAWNHYDVEMRNWPKERRLICASFADQIESGFWSDIFDRVHAGQIDTWDYQWLYACWTQSGMSIIPDVNLVSNLGFGPDATHTHEPTDVAALPVADVWDVKHPQHVVRHREADDYSFDHAFGGLRLKVDTNRAEGKLQLVKSLTGKALRRFRHG